METVGKHIVRQPLEELIGTGTKGTQLRVLDMELTERCNNNCIHCYINRPEKDRDALERELSTDQIRALLNEAAALGCLTVRFTGGEPLLRTDFEEVYQFARQCGLRVRILTNATLMTPHLVDLFAGLPPLEPIEITLYGMQPATCDTVTGVPGSFAAAWRGIKLLQNCNVPFIARYARLPHNSNDIPAFERWARQIPWLEDAPMYTVFYEGRGRRDSESRNRLIDRLNPTPEAGLEFLVERIPDYLERLDRLCHRSTDTPSDRLFTCDAGLGCGCIDAYGYLQPCVLLRHPDTVYDLKKGSLKEALKHFFPAIRQKRARNRNYLNRCARCILRGLCDQCPARSWLATGDLESPVDQCCRLAHAQAERIGRVRPGQKGWQTGSLQEALPKTARCLPESKNRPESRTVTDTHERSSP